MDSGNFLYGSPSGCSGATCPPNNVPAQRSYDGVEFRVTKAVVTTGAAWPLIPTATSGATTPALLAVTFPQRPAAATPRSAAWAFISLSFHGNQTVNLRAGTFRPTARTQSRVTATMCCRGHTSSRRPLVSSSTSTKVRLLPPMLTSATPSPPSFGAYGVPNAEDGAFPTDIVGRGKFLPLTQNADGSISVGTPTVRRTPWYTQSDFQISQDYKISERKVLSFSATATEPMESALRGCVLGRCYSELLRPIRTPGWPGSFYRSALL